MDKSGRHFILFHLFFITTIVVLWAFLMYPYESGRWWKQENLKHLYQALEKYKDEQGHFPSNLSTLHEDANGCYFLGAKNIERFYIGDAKQIQFELKDGKPVLTDLGTDCRQGGMDSNMDIAYPREYQKPVSFISFLTTGAFFRSFFFGLVLASAISGCLYGIWQKRFSCGKPSFGMAIFFSVLFLGFEAFLAVLIMAAHIYPHH